MKNSIEYICGTISITKPQPVADPGFPRRGGANPRVPGKNLLFGKIFAENGMKMKEIGQRERP